MNQNQKEKVLVLGAGISGINAGKLLTEVGRPVILYDGNKEKNEAELREQLGNPSDLTIVLGERTYELLAQAGLCVISPGISTAAAFVMQGRAAVILVWCWTGLA